MLSVARRLSIIEMRAHVRQKLISIIRGREVLSPRNLALESPEHFSRNRQPQCSAQLARQQAMTVIAVVLDASGIAPEKCRRMIALTGGRGCRLMPHPARSTIVAHSLRFWRGRRLTGRRL